MKEPLEILQVKASAIPDGPTANQAPLISLSGLAGLAGMPIAGAPTSTNQRPLRSPAYNYKTEASQIKAG
jgi:hypothetical protein